MILDYLARGPVARGARWQLRPAQPVRYEGEARTPHPVPPFQVFGLRYRDDIVLETDHPHWSMHEYARVLHAGRELWIAKDSDPDGVQTITAPLTDLSRYLAEVPAPRRVAAVDVEERSDARRLEVHLRTTTPRGEQVVLDFSAPRPRRPERRRNGSTFNHSAQMAAVVLDVSHRQLSGVRAAISFDGRPAGIRRVLGVVPVKALVRQTQGGFVTASMALEAAVDGWTVRRPIATESWPTTSVEVWEVDGEDLVHRRDWGETRYVFEARELVSVRVEADGDPEPAFELELDAPLPDLGRPFSGEVVRAFRADVGGRVGHGCGRIGVRWDGDAAVVEVRPLAPRWFASRPLLTTVRREGEVLELRTRRI